MQCKPICEKQPHMCNANVCNAALCVQRRYACAMQPGMCNAAPRVQCRHAGATQTCIFNIAPHAQCSLMCAMLACKTPRLCLAVGSAIAKALAAGHPLSVKISCSSIGREPSAPRWRIAAALRGRESKHGIGVQGDGAADSYNAAHLWESFQMLCFPCSSPLHHHSPFLFLWKKFRHNL